MLAVLIGLAAIAVSAPAAVAGAPKGAIGVAPQAPKGAQAKGAGGVKGAVAASPGFAQAVPSISADAKPQPRERNTGLDAQVGSLPFTGWDLIILGGVSMVLSGAGFMVRRLSMPRAPRV
jgi:hypothetical protein